MSDRSAIEWTDTTWNPTTGCDRVSAGCDHCYALTLAGRLKAMGSAKYQVDGDPRTSGPGFGLAVHADTLTTPESWWMPRRVFVDSMSDLFHSGVPDGFLCRVFDTMATAHRHTFQVLTKRHARMQSFVTRYLSGGFVTDWSRGPLANTVDRPPANIWLGVSVEDQHWAAIRISALLATPAAVRWVSAEPLLGPVDLSRWLGQDAVGPGPAHAPDWVVVGGESGRGARPMDPAWALSLVERCRAAGVPVYVKQLGVVAGGRHHHDMATFPPGLRIRQYPEPLAPARSAAIPGRAPVSTVEDG